MTKLKDVIEKNLSIPYEDIATSQLGRDEELCREIQQILYENNFYRFEVDGIYGKITREALRDFKEAYALGGGDVLGSTTAEFLLRINKRNPGDGNYDFSTKQGTQRAIISECRKQGLTLKTQMAYVLATVEHETANTFKPVKEAFWLSEDWRLRNLWYSPYYGRGYVQLTHKSNYEKYSDILNIDLVNNPDKVMEPKIALFILVDGMAKGKFTGKRLGQYVNTSKTDFFEARRVVNLLDKAHHIANLAQSWLSKISSLEATLESTAPESLPEAAEELEILLLKQAISS
jgi:peptidoglycan hydrolase-like protein with peptidoglycan-binding domain